jgi:hypothetical protein
MSKSYKHVGDLIDRMETKIDAGLVTPEYLETLQHQLDDIVDETAVRDNRFSQYANELQSLLYRTQNKDEDALEYLSVALEEAGSPRKLHSSLLRNYVLSNPRIVSEHVSTSVMQTGPGDLSLLSKKQRAFMRRQGLETTPEVHFLVRDPKQFSILYFLSGSYYESYWIYKNWQALRDASGRRISPFWRTVFSIFYIWPLFRSMTLLAKSRGYKEDYSGEWLATGYILAFIISEVITLFSGSKLVLAIEQIAYIVINAIFYLLVQRAARFAVSKKPATKHRPVNYVEWAFVVVGALLTIQVTYLNYFDSSPLPSVWQQIHTNNTKK